MEVVTCCGGVRSVGVGGVVGRREPEREFVGCKIRGLSGRRLLSVVLGANAQRCSIGELTLVLLGRLKNVRGLEDTAVGALAGVGNVKRMGTVRLLSVMRLSGEVGVDSMGDIGLGGSGIVFSCFGRMFRSRGRRCFCTVCLSSGSGLVDCGLLFGNAVGASYMRPERMFGCTMLRDTCSVVIVRGRPSKSPAPDRRSVRVAGDLFRLNGVVTVPMMSRVIFNGRSCCDFCRGLGGWYCGAWCLV